MKKIGGYLAFFGIFAIALDYMGRVPSLLAWIYNWGDTVAWAIKIGLVVVGAGMFFMGKSAPENVQPSQANEGETKE
jgi:hypothetical protein